MRKHLVGLLPILFLFSCTDLGLAPENRDFNISLKYGIFGANQLDTFHNSFTKDLLMDGSITVSLVLSAAELQDIQKKLLEIDFFSYPDTFMAQQSDTPFAYVEPSEIFVFRVKRGSAIKVLHWDTGIVPWPTGDRLAKLQEAIAFIKRIIETKPEYLRLPSPRGGYL